MRPDLPRYLQKKFSFVLFVWVWCVGELPGYIVLFTAIAYQLLILKWIAVCRKHHQGKNPKPSILVMFFLVFYHNLYTYLVLECYLTILICFHLAIDWKNWILHSIMWKCIYRKLIVTNGKMHINFCIKLHEQLWNILENNWIILDRLKKVWICFPKSHCRVEFNLLLFGCWHRFYCKFFYYCCDRFDH